MKHLLLVFNIILLFSCRTVKKFSTQEEHSIDVNVSGRTDSVSTSNDNSSTIIIEDKVEDGTTQIDIEIDSTVKWDSLWMKNPPKSPTEAVAQLINSPRTKNVKVTSSIKTASTITTKVDNDKKDSVRVIKQNDSTYSKEDGKNTSSIIKKGMSTGIIIWGILAIVIIAGLLIINYYFPILPGIKKFLAVFKKKTKSNA